MANKIDRPVSRRTVLKGLAGGTAALATSELVGGLGPMLARAASSSHSSEIVIGYVSPETGSLASFATPDDFVLKRIRETSAFSKGLTKGKKKYSIKIIEVDSQSDPTRASQVTKNLILQDKVDLIVTSSAPETVNPVAGVCESEHVPCVSTVCPWESWYYAGLGATPPGTSQKFAYNTLFFFGIREFGKCFVPMWNRIHKKYSTDKVIACMFPNDADGNAFRMGFPPVISAAGYTEIDGGAYPDGQTGYTSMISQFKDGNADFYLNCPLPPDFNTMWKQAHEQGFKPKLATVAKVLLFPSDTTALGSLVENIATDAWWTPYSPYRSSLTGESAKQLAAAFESASGQQWTQSIGSTYTLFEIAHQALARASDPHDKREVAAQLHSLKMQSICGHLDFTSGPAPGVAIIEPVGVQWKKGTKYPFSMYVVDNSANKDVPINGKLEPTRA
ncbi:MAG TPA: ABC transporter substrate-binding protein [Candidatus Dormibacteraeota bacterium]|nr:ABC transporter substrate-binding protein [Candidatus Dormibacteraeota bacterium]